MTYELYILPKAKKKLDKFPHSEKIEERLKELKNFPNVRNIIKIGENLYRMRIGSYRALFKVYEADSIIVIVNVDVRGRVYKQF
ncbi:MAG: type II toxin-antitoxin system RelE/ParE family toxin [Archaeoglobus sp.]|uniref:type II toxin-antitoxin system RelE family toxin n=1 Tax=Archaeoglobus sp. TaxID=1872626 RepID=UPI001DECFA0E|nr:type II toxin-antitoxin system RelE/ParE family toxin [Archaeoglobus sp.]MBO8180637.1 type II toxin-antitoxin system RelE/ParE family toxin [Archaeoglobus sp.]